ncbi:MAG: helix-hairpin-helix domain-containing protein [Candidatus Omnitrophota bacterium]
MSRIEKIIAAVLIMIALTGVAFSCYVKLSQNSIRIISLGQAEDSERAIATIKQVSVININTADKYTLTKIPGIGPYLAQNIIDYRREYGLFTSAVELMKVKGIGPAKYDKMRGYVRVDE